MSIARAFTLRSKRSETPLASAPATDAHLRRMASVIDRSKISAPVELISTTNMLSYNAPDVATLRKMRQASSASSTTSSSEEDSDGSTNVRSSAELTDASSLHSSPTSPEANHLSCYFQAAQNQQNPQKAPRRSSSTADLHRPMHSESHAPIIPERALSHSKSAHLQLARKRSLQTLNSSHSASSSSSSANRTPSIREQRTSIDIIKGGVEPNHPFGKELEKLSEVVEELGGAVRDAEMDEDAAHMREHGLARFTADDYLMELRPLYLGVFGRNHPTQVNAAWI